MQARIASEMKRADLQTDNIGYATATSSIQSTILSAIAQYQRHLFYFNEQINASWSTVANQEFYGTTDGVPADIVDVDTLTIIYSTTRLPVKERTWRYLEERQTGTFKGVPTEYAYFAQKFRLFPIPTAVSDLNLAYLQRLAAPTAGTDVGPWMNEAEELIRFSA